MCAIIDNDVVHESFGAKRTEAGRRFFDWVNRGGKLIVGGQLRVELDGNESFRLWRVDAARRGRVVVLPDDQVAARARELERSEACESNDSHVIAIAQLGGARLLFSNDQALHKDFKNRSLVRDGRVYSTSNHAQFRQSHQRLLSTSACP